ncbi:MFS general substrate transporter [Auriscalpium vulgare]|uniref:MFS general substrate transporter n=1 Tax=Auriscalpium vulgare TaxID=40419 RepID=A0ACB8RSA6_9AGAM|nr:MFS general substrate transporter [Auriscalpium vulgare]
MSPPGIRGAWGLVWDVRIPVLLSSSWVCNAALPTRSMDCLHGLTSPSTRPMDLKVQERYRTEEAPDLSAEDVDPEIAQGVSETEGTYHQLQLLTQRTPKRRYFFSPLNPAYAQAVHEDARTVQYTDKDEAAVRRKIDLRVLSLIIVSYNFNQFDRTNVGNAHVIPAFNDNFGISTNSKWTLGLSIFYVGYCILEIPANILQRRIGANRFFFLSMFWWGWSSLSLTYAKGYAAFLVLRVLLGIGEAGFYAGMVYYLSFWYKRHELAIRYAFCITATLPGALGGLLAFGLVRAHTSVLAGWQFLFLVEGIPVILMSFIMLSFLPSFPFSASFLTPRERAIAQARLNRDHRPQSHGGMNGWQGFKAIISDVNAWLCMLIYASFNVGVTTVSYFVPTLIRELGFTAINAQGLTVAPYLFAWLMVIFQAWHSDRTRDRGWHIMFSGTIALIGYIVLATCVEKSVGAAYFALFFVLGGLYSMFPMVMSWATAIFSPTSKRGVGTAFVVGISSTISIASPQIYFDPEDDFRKAHAISAGCVLLSILITFALRTRLTLLNKANKAKLVALKERGLERFESDDAGAEEIVDTDPRYHFMT